MRIVNTEIEGYLPIQNGNGMTDIDVGMEDISIGASVPIQEIGISSPSEEIGVPSSENMNIGQTEIPSSIVVTPYVPEEIYTPDLVIKPINGQAITFIDEAEMVHLGNEGYKMSELPSNVIVVPMSIAESPVQFEKVVEIAKENPDLSIQEIVDAVKIANQDNIGIVDIPKLNEFFPGAAAAEIISNIQNEVPLSEETANFIIENKIITNPEEILSSQTVIDIPKLNEIFPGTIAYKIQQDFKNNIPLSPEVAKILVENKIVSKPYQVVEKGLPPKEKVISKNILDKLTDYIYNLISK